ncbi:Cu_bind_like domain-containing protein [Cephalotus follicularis]|uniref:Cu_bind_like domain-containing protein n=1 Tax=Cephalotus follicularis TaxID=3775 RepID=A0A1Q3CBH4_CEPFO|nr:Cu_bind_like domain-containing protein [Cephalotus follicularis]
MEKEVGKMLMVVVVLICAVVVVLPEVGATRWIVGGNMGWTTNVNYTVWAQDKHFYNGDWLFFVYDRNQMNVLEVNKTDYESCNADNPLQNWTRGAGRDVAPLNVTRNYYYISGKGFCFGGMKLAVHVENLPPPPSASPLNEKSASPTSIYGGVQYVLPAVFAIGTIWAAFIQYR